MSGSEAGPLRRFGVWISDKKSQKLNWSELQAACLKAGFELVKLNVERGLEEQGPLHVLLHKLTDILARAALRDDKATRTIERVEQYLAQHPHVTVVDPLDNVRILLDRERYYGVLEREPSFRRRGIFTPAFAALTAAAADHHQHNLDVLRRRGVRFPCVVKPLGAHGSRAAHQMALVFNERGLRACRPPCVAQSFVNHSARLYKVYVINDRYHISERPSLKNFYMSEDSEPIHFNTGDVCKADSNSTLSILDPHDPPHALLHTALDENKIKHIIKVLRREIGLILYGFDVVIENATGHHAVIDINVFPGYDNYPRFYEHLMAGVNAAVERRGGARGGGEDWARNGLVNVGSGRHGASETSGD